MTPTHCTAKKIPLRLRRTLHRRSKEGQRLRVEVTRLETRNREETPLLKHIRSETETETGTDSSGIRGETTSLKQAESGTQIEDEIDKDKVKQAQR